MVVKRVVEVAKMVVRVAIKALAPAPSGEDATDTGSEQSANRASASRFAAGGSNQNYDVFEDIDSEEYHLQSSLAPDKGCEGKKMLSKILSEISIHVKLILLYIAYLDTCYTADDVMRHVSFTIYLFVF
jgi:hypothetical protein